MTEQEKLEIIHRMMSEYHYYSVRTSGRWSRSFRDLTGKVGLIKPETFEFYIKNPSSQVIYEANRIYNNTIRYLRFKEFYNSESIIDFMKKHIVLCEDSFKAEEDDDLDPVYYWSDAEDKKMEAYSDAIETIKIKLYRNSDATNKTIDEIRKDLRKSQRLYNELYSRKHHFSYMTAEDIASRLYTRYLYDNTIYTIDKKPLRGLPSSLLDAIANIVRNDSISGTQLREIAHTSPWLQLYKTAQPNPFDGVTLTSDVLQLMSLTRWYEWVREYSPHDKESLPKPSDKVMEDDDMLDGWFILYERENKNKRQDLQIESSKFNVETFVMARTPQEADDIWCRNNKISRTILKTRAEQIFGTEDGQIIKNEELGDVKMDISIDINKLGFAAQKAKASGAKLTTGAR